MPQAMIYLDHAATSPLTPTAAEAWRRAAAVVGNPSSLHAGGRAARRVVEEARERVAERLGAEPQGVIFTSGGTEADNLAVIGGARARRAGDPGLNQVFVSAVEHPAVLEAARALRAEGFTVVEWPVGRDGRVDLAAARQSLAAAAGTIALASVMWANNETGAIQPLAELAPAVRAGGAPCHSDAVQAVAYGPVRLRAADDDGPDAVSVSAHKLGGPVGVGALVARRDFPLTALSHGGGQERRLRSGTIPAALVAAFAAALDEACDRRQDEARRLAELSARLTAGLGGLPGVVVTGPQDPAARSPHIVNAVFDGCLGENMLLLLDAAGLACSAGSACAAGVARPSHVLTAMGHPAEREARWGLRFSLGVTSRDSNIDALLTALPAAMARARTAGGE
ncbi:MAG: aminotransferase class V-fold PLP-dependent enzyme [Propionibacteriaceae bacterium]|jgi:cysteine desulfurase|nr:aminotransferase class V-fold PLP-dependent enzyme [Propionibacteriaceae bacterium]